MTTVATLGGVNLANASKVGWELTAGTAPHQRIFVVHERQWSKLRDKQGQPLTLRIKPANGKTKTFENLYIIRQMAARLPMHRAFVLSDSRWLWEYVQVVRSYNVPRRTGDTYLVGGGPVEIQEAVDSYTYAPWSLHKKAGDPDKRWTARKIIEDLMNLAEAEVRDFPGWEFDGESFPIKDDDSPDSVAVQGLELRGNLQETLNQAFNLIPGVSVMPSYKGEFFVYDRTRHSRTKEILDGLPPFTSAGATPTPIGRWPTRPSLIRCYLEREVELRFDNFEEGKRKSDTDPVEIPGDMRMFNVIELVDPETEIDGVKYGPGVYHDFDSTLEAWDEDKIEGAPTLNAENVRKFWFVLDALFVPFGDLSPKSAEANWPARIASIKKHYRRTWQIPKQWRDVIRDMKPWRVGILDPVTTARAPAKAWSDYTYEPSTKFRVQTRKKKDKQFVWLNVEGYPGFTGELDTDATSPAKVRVIDAQLGIIHVDYHLDRFGLRDAILPGVFKENGAGKLAAPTRDLSEKKGIFASHWRTTSGIPWHLEKEFGVAVIFTALPGAPNSKGRCYSYDVKPAHLKSMLGDEFNVENGRGPVYEVYIPPSLLTAWYGWQSVKARETAKELFNLKKPPDDKEENNDLDGYEILNEKYIIPAVCRAAAVVVYARHIDAHEGNAAYHLGAFGTPQPGGNVRGFVHDVDEDGRLVTQIRMPSERIARNILAQLTPDAAHLVQGLIKHPPG